MSPRFAVWFVWVGDRFILCLFYTYIGDKVAGRNVRICTYVPPEMLELIDRRIRELAFKGYADYIRSLIRDDLLRGGYYGRASRNP